jgi:SPP1 gp7 family putative phage head morphogenesis protein
MTEKQILVIADGIEPAYRRLFRSLSNRASAAYVKGGLKSTEAAIKASKRALYSLLVGNYTVAIPSGVAAMQLRKTSKARPRDKRFVDPRSDPDFAAKIAADYIKLHAENRADEVTDTTLDLARQAVAKGIEEELTPAEIAGRIKDTVGGAVGDYRARMIARTETASAFNSATFETAQEMQESTGPLNKVWIAANDDRVRETHADADGQSVGLDDDFKVGESTMAFPSDPSGDASEVINCRCTLVYEPQEDT